MSHEKFTELYCRNEQALLRFVWSLMPDRTAADDIIQAAMVQLWEHFEEYDQSRPFFPWACRYTYRQVLLHRRRESTRKRFFNLATLELLRQDSPQQSGLEEARLKALRVCLAQLTDRQRSLIRHRYDGEGPITELANQFGQAVGTLYKSLERTRKSLADCVSKKLTSEEVYE